MYGCMYQPGYMLWVGPRSFGANNGDIDGGLCRWFSALDADGGERAAGVASQDGAARRAGADATGEVRGRGGGKRQPRLMSARAHKSGGRSGREWIALPGGSGANEDKPFVVLCGQRVAGGGSVAESAQTIYKHVLQELIGRIFCRQIFCRQGGVLAGWRGGAISGKTTAGIGKDRE
eukprot:1009935-Prorocentrum_minimum.AAC.3